MLDNGVADVDGGVNGVNGEDSVSGGGCGGWCWCLRW